MRRDEVRITFKGKRAIKYYFANNLVENKEVRVYSISKEEIAIEGRYKTETIKKIFRDILNQNLFKEVDIQDEAIKNKYTGLGYREKRVFRFMVQHEKEEFSLNELLNEVRFCKSTLETILGRLLKRGIVKRKEQQGEYVYFYVNEDDIENMMKLLY